MKEHQKERTEMPEKAERVERTDRTEKVEKAMEYLIRMAEGRLPISNDAVEHDSDLNSSEVVRSLFFVLDVMKFMIEERNSKKQAQRKQKQQFPVDCLEDFVYEEDKTITHFVAQLKYLAGNPDVKGVSIKKITDWLRVEGYLKDTIDAESKDKITIITEKGVEKGIYTEVRHTRLGQEYEVIIYSEKAQRWIIDNLKSVL